MMVRITTAAGKMKKMVQSGTREMMLTQRELAPSSGLFLSTQNTTLIALSITDRASIKLKHDVTVTSLVT